MTNPQPPQDLAQDRTSLIEALRSSAPYIHAHRGRTFVVALPGEAATMQSFAALIYDIALLHSLGVRIVLVHGARPQIDAALDAANVQTQIVHGVRVTDAAALECVKRAVGGLRMEIEALLSTGLASTPMAGARLQVAGGNLVIAKPLGIQHGVDHQHTGEVRRVDTAALDAHLDRGHIVLLSPVGYSPTGEIFNLFAEDVATQTASALGADKLIFLHGQQELHRRNEAITSQLTLEDVDALIAKNQDNNETLDAADSARLQAAVTACRAGVARAHLVSYDQDGALLRELYSRDGVGTLITAQSYDTLRQADAEDAGGLLNLISPMETSGALVARSREQLELEIGNFTVMLRDGLITACCALMPYPEENVGEVACVAVLPQYRQQGRADRLLAEVEKRARGMHLSKLFALTTKAPHWFIERGFEPAELSDLPLAKQQLYNYTRNSMVLVKAL